MFQEVSNSSHKPQKVLRTLKQFFKVSKSFYQYHTILGTLKQFSEILEGSCKFQKVVRSLKKFSKPQIVLTKFKKFSEISNSSLQLQCCSPVVQCIKTISGFLKTCRCLVVINTLSPCVFTWFNFSSDQHNSETSSFILNHINNLQIDHAKYIRLYQFLRKIRAITSIIKYTCQISIYRVYQSELEVRDYLHAVQVLPFEIGLY